MNEQVLLKNIRNPDAGDIAVYEKSGGYTGLRIVLGTCSPDEVIEQAKSSGLRGRGGENGRASCGAGV